MVNKKKLVVARLSKDSMMREFCPFENTHACTIVSFSKPFNLVAFVLQ